ncbi:DUF4439 domain-containing protein [Corynebacterium sp. A21]|uniref:DUF4439 domain-containing protein n=1 Tax=Corynebacterium sp. A21 TaxID=3457318 RepID=UPI003FD5FB4A
MNRKLLPLATLMILSLPALSACAVVDLLGPRPNSELQTLAAQAVHDEVALTEQDPAAAQLRGRQADTLLTEIQRLCGTDETGTVPTTCEVDLSGYVVPSGAPETPAEIINAALGNYVHALDAVPEQSRDLLTTQAIELAAADGDIALPDPLLITAEEDLNTARSLLEQELAAEYGLGVALAFADADTRTTIDALLSAHRERILALQLLLQDSGQVPEPQAGYEFDQAPEPVDTASARLFADTIAADTHLRWQSAAVNAESVEWRGFAVEAAAHSRVAQPTLG